MRMIPSVLLVSAKYRVPLANLPSDLAEACDRQRCPAPRWYSHVRLPIPREDRPVYRIPFELVRPLSRGLPFRQNCRGDTGRTVIERELDKVYRCRRRVLQRDLDGRSEVSFIIYDANVSSRLPVIQHHCPMRQARLLDPHHWLLLDNLALEPLGRCGHRSFAIQVKLPGPMGRHRPPRFHALPLRLGSISEDPRFALVPLRLVLLADTGQQDVRRRAVF